MKKENHLIKEDRTRIIKELHILADQVRKLKEIHRQKRPIVIEFSGSPKSGKTSCINSLALFLKRNDFSVEIVQERANVCPVSDKQSPMFNIWTSCMSLSNMIGILKNKKTNCDVLILDRGIFDALCWFNWLEKTQRMELKQKKTIENFLIMDEFVKRIDIVFAFSAEPQVSIEREYATLLTDRPGTIMNKKVLSEYLFAIKETINEKGCYFHSIQEIDTSKKNQDEVGKEVTEKTLNTLMSLLMEKIGYIYLDQDIKKQLEGKRVFEYKELSGSFINIDFGLRGEIENNSSYLQPIPIAIITNKDRTKILTIKKTPKAVSNESPEKDKLLIYIGGHTRIEDKTLESSTDFLELCKETLNRELSEEIGITLAFNDTKPIIIYTPDNEKSKKHMGVCFVKEVDIDSIHLQLDSQELVQNKGTSKSGRFQEIEFLLKNINELESWSIEILKSCFNAKISNQVNIFDFIELNNIQY